MSPLVVIVGETASGKTALAIEIAKKLNGEIICADSWTVYRGFDIGTAKPTEAEQRDVPHHLLDVADPSEGFSAAVFQRMAKVVIEDITSRGKLPIMVGGTGLYTDSILYDYSFLPPSDLAKREELNALSLEELLAKAEAMQLDTSTIDTRNKRRVIRLIENDGVLPTKSSLREHTIVLGIRRPLEELRERIVQRVDVMVHDGLAEEVARLGERYGWNCEPMKAPGYTAFSHFVKGSITLEQAKERTVSQHLQLAKKQRTWFKRNDSIQWVEPEYQNADIPGLVLKTLNK